jgi:P pilus assembly chaperone PapD
MNAFRRVVAGLAVAFAATVSATAVGDGGVNVTINNNTTKNLSVTALDLNANPPTRVLSSETINGFASLTIQISADASGEGHLSWTATTTGKHMRECGHHEKAGLRDGDTVNISVNAECDD